MSSKLVVRIHDVYKTFKLPHEKSGSIKNAIVGWNRKSTGYESQKVLKGISFNVEEGDFFGIIGRNGSGKSTLLKIISQIYSPDKGKVIVNGKLVPFIELGVGFNPELTGRENVFLNGSLLGFSRKETEAMYDKIVEFAELEKFMDQKLKNYSSGMQVRLAFSIAIQADGDILLLDEVLAVGDEAFQRKCNDYFDELKKRKKTVILVTHSMDSVRKYCNKAIMLRNGEIAFQGSPEDVSNEYSLENLNVSSSDSSESVHSSVIKDLEVKVQSAELITQDDEIKITIKYRVPSGIPTRVKLSMHDIDRNAPIFATDSPVYTDEIVSTTLSVKISAINDTNLKISVSIRDENYDTVDFLADSKAPIISVKRTDYLDSTRKTTWAVLFDRGEWY